MTGGRLVASLATGINENFAMVALPRRNEGRAIGFMMTPMIDVVFLLIIFFLISSHLTRQEKQTKLPLPVATMGAHPAEMDAPKLVVNVEATGQMSMSGANVTKEEFQGRLAATLAKLNEKDRSQFEVRIRCSRDVPYRFMQPIMNACVGQGIWNITYAVYRPEDAQ